MDETACKEKEKKPFDPTDPPHGSKNYNLETLEPEQKEALEKKKINQRRENEAYLNAHPEIKGLVSMLLRNLLEIKSTKAEEVKELVGEFFRRPRLVIVSELLHYLLNKQYEGEIIEMLKREVEEAAEEYSESEN